MHHYLFFVLHVYSLLAGNAMVICYLKGSIKIMIYIYTHIYMHTYTEKDAE